MLEKSSNSAERLNLIMSEKMLRQSDVIEMCKPYCKKYNVRMNRSNLSQYLSGIYEPSQKKLTILSMALGVTETWLMGFDVPRERQANLPAQTNTTIENKAYEITPRNEIENFFLQLDKQDQLDAFSYAISLLDEIKKAMVLGWLTSLSLNSKRKNKL